MSDELQCISDKSLVDICCTKGVKCFRYKGLGDEHNVLVTFDPDVHIKKYITGLLQTGGGCLELAQFPVTTLGRRGSAKDLQAC